MQQLLMIVCIIAGMTFSLSTAAAGQDQNQALILRCVGIKDDNVDLAINNQYVNVKYKTIDVPIIMEITDKILTYQRADGKGFYNINAVVRISDKIIRFGGSKGGGGRISFVVESLGLGSVHYTYRIRNSLMTKVEIVNEFEGSPPTLTLSEKETVIITQFLCKGAA